MTLRNRSIARIVLALVVQSLLLALLLGWEGVEETDWYTFKRLTSIWVFTSSLLLFFWVPVVLYLELSDKLTFRRTVVSGAVVSVIAGLIGLLVRLPGYVGLRSGGEVLIQGGDLTTEGWMWAAGLIAQAAVIGTVLAFIFWVIAKAGSQDSE